MGFFSLVGCRCCDGDAFGFDVANVATTYYYLI